MRKRAAGTAAALTLLCPAVAHADSSAAQIEQLRQMVFQLQKEVKQLKSDRRHDGAAAAPARRVTASARPARGAGVRHEDVVPVLGTEGDRRRVREAFTGPMQIDGHPVPALSADAAPAPVAFTPAPWAVSAGTAPAEEMNLSSSSPTFLTQTDVDDMQPVFKVGPVSVRLGGFIDMSNIYRDKNLSSGPATPWGSFPYSGSPEAHLSEYRPSAQLSRFSMLISGKPSSSVKVEAYVEGDFGGSGSNSNGVQTNSYVPRMRQAYFAADDSKLGLHFLAGQAWSLATGYNKTLLRRHEQLPPVVDSNLIPGVTFTRVPQVRVIKDFNRVWWLGLSVETPQATLGFDDSSLESGDSIPAAAGQSAGPRVYYNNKGSGMLDPEARYSLDAAPDIVLKTAVDTAFGHYELYGLARWFRTASLTGSGEAGRIRSHVKFGGGVGGSMAVPLFSDKVQLVGNILAGRGIGRYGPSQLPDMTLASNGAPAPLHQIDGALGIIGHPGANLLLYGYGGVESAGQSVWQGADGSEYGYGSSTTNLSGCSIMAEVCNAETHALASGTVGGWWHLLQGRYGSVMAGVQYTYVKKFAFRGVDNEHHTTQPTTSGNTVFVTFRYYPFQN